MSLFSYQRCPFGWSRSRMSRTASAWIWNQIRETNNNVGSTHDKDLKPRHSFPSFHFYPLSIIIHHPYTFRVSPQRLHFFTLLFFFLFLPKFLCVCVCAFWPFEASEVHILLQTTMGRCCFSPCFFFLSLCGFFSTLLKLLHWTLDSVLSVLEIETEYA